MASESTEEAAVAVSLGPELEAWLDERARELGVDREAVLVRLLTAAREADAVDGTADVDGLAAAVADTDAFGDAVGDAVDEALHAHEDDLEATEARLAEQIETVEADFREKIEDVRERVIQVKQEADEKAPADHTHEELDRVDAIGRQVDDLEGELAALESHLSDLEATVEALEPGAAEDVERTVEELQERLKTVAWVVSDLREAHEKRADSATLEQLKRSAAEADVSRARCERCGEGVEIGLLTEPTCPHCDATVTEVAPSSGFFGKPRLLAASQLESGEER